MEDRQVPAVMKPYDFTALKMPAPDWAKETYNVSAAPSNFLLDSEGRVIFRPRVHNRDTQHVLEQEIESLLQRGGAPASGGL